AVSRTSLRPPALDPQELRNRVHQAVRELFVRLSRKRPVVAIIDDVQWSDRDSRSVFAESLRPPEGPVLLALVTLRSSEQRPEAAPRTLASLAELGDVAHVPLGPLDAREARALAARLLGEDDAARAAAIADEAQGIPLFIDALARHAQAQG